MDARVVNPSAAELLEARIAPAFSAVFSIGALNGANGFEILGAASRDNAGFSVSNAGDINGDGFDDVIVGAYQADAGGDYSGASYVVFGALSGFPAEVDLAALDGSNGFRLSGVGNFDRSGQSVSGAGDVNADGFDDLIIGGSSGAYVVFGKQSAFPASLSLTALDGTNGFKISGVQSDYHPVAAAGDVNADGYDDVIVGSARESSSGLSDNGAAFVIFGHPGVFGANFAVSALNGANGFRINGAAEVDFAGTAVSGAGDVNGDGFDDLLLGVQGADTPAFNSGAAYVVFGQGTGFAPSLSLAALDGTNGFRLSGVAQNDGAGGSVSDAGDVNGDGLADIIVGARGADLNGDYSGVAYVVFGKRNGFSANSSLSAVQGANGFMVVGATSEQLGAAVSGAGDVNGDGFSDLIIGANFLPRSYVVYGQAVTSSIKSADLNGINGFVLDGSGHAVSGAGDVNNDGVDDMLLGDYLFTQNDVAFRGAAWVIFGQGSVDLQLSMTDGAATTTPGSALSYALAYGNIGNVAAIGTVINEILPPGLSFIAAENPGWSQVDNTLVYDIGTLAAGATGTTTLLLHATALAPAGLAQITSTAHISDNGASGTDRIPADNIATDSDTLEAAPDFIVTLSDAVTSAGSGMALTYTVSYHNDGNQNATGVALTETLPSGATFNAETSTPGWSETAPDSGLFKLDIGALAGGGAGGGLRCFRLRSTVPLLRDLTKYPARCTSLTTRPMVPIRPQTITPPRIPISSTPRLILPSRSTMRSRPPLPDGQLSRRFLTAMEGTRTPRASSSPRRYPRAPRSIPL